MFEHTLGLAQLLSSQATSPSRPLRTSCALVAALDSVNRTGCVARYLWPVPLVSPLLVATSFVLQACDQFEDEVAVTDILRMLGHRIQRGGLGDEQLQNITAVWPAAHLVPLMLACIHHAISRLCTRGALDLFPVDGLGISPDQALLCVT